MPISQGFKAMQRRMSAALKVMKAPRVSGGAARTRVSRASGTPPPGRRSSGTTAVSAPPANGGSPPGDRDMFASLPLLIQVCHGDTNIGWCNCRGTSLHVVRVLASECERIVDATSYRDKVIRRVQILALMQYLISETLGPGGALCQRLSALRHRL